MILDIVESQGRWGAQNGQKSLWGENIEKTRGEGKKWPKFNTGQNRTKLPVGVSWWWWVSPGAGGWVSPGGGVSGRGGGVSEERRGLRGLKPRLNFPPPHLNGSDLFRLRPAPKDGGLRKLKPTLAISQTCTLWCPGLQKQHQISTRRHPERHKESEMMGKGRKRAKFWATQTTQTKSVLAKVGHDRLKGGGSGVQVFSV